MAGFGGALAGIFAGAVGGAGTGMLADVEHRRELKKQQLADDRADRLEANRQAFLREEGAANRASQEKLTQATLGVQEKLGMAQVGETRHATDTGAKMTQAQIDARRDEVYAQIESGEKQTKLQTDTQKDIAQAQIEAQKDLNVTFQTQADGSSVMMRAGKPVSMPVDPATGKPMVPAISDNDTNEAKNVKYLLTLGVDKDKAMALVYNAKNANRDLAQAGIFKSIVDGMSTMKNLGEDDFDFAQKKAATITDSIYGPADAPTAPAAPASPAAPSSATQEKTPLTSAQKQKLISDAKTAILPKEQGGLGRSRTAVRNALEAAGVDPADAGL